jgi:hypothetical protein
MTAMENWELFAKKGTERPATIAITSWGLIAFNKAALFELGLLSSGAHVRLYYNHAARKIGLRACAADACGARRVRPRKHTAGADVSARGFLEHYGIPHVKTQWYPFTVEEDMIVLDLGRDQERTVTA